MNEEYTSLGLMSGTSGDGVDASIIQSNGDSKYEVINDKYYEYDSQIYQNIHNLKEKINNHNDLKLLSKELNDLERKITLFHAKVVKEIDDDFFITPGDYPLIMKSTYEKILNAKGILRVPTFNNRRGHPLFISKELIGDLLCESDDSNLKEFRNKYVITNVETNDSGILKDIDTVNDYIKLKTERKEDWYCED